MLDQKDSKSADKITEKNLLIEYPYICPVCFRYYDSMYFQGQNNNSLEILTTDCCNNYLCFFCAQKINKSTKISTFILIKCTLEASQDKFEKYYCIYGCEKELVLRDNDPEKKVLFSMNSQE